MPVNTPKALQERLNAAVKELETRNGAYQEDPGNEERKKSFDDQLAVVQELRSQLSAAKATEDLMASQQLDGDLSDRRSQEELEGMTPQQRRSDAVSPLANPDAKGYSLARAIDAAASRTPLSGVELEVDQELQKRFGESSRRQRSSNGGDGFLMPLTLNFHAMAEQRSRQMPAPPD